MIDRTSVQVKGQEWEDQTGTETEKKDQGKNMGKTSYLLRAF